MATQLGREQGARAAPELEQASLKETSAQEPGAGKKRCSTVEIERRNIYTTG